MKYIYQTQTTTDNRKKEVKYLSEPKRYMNVQELAEYMSISKWMIYKYIKNREIPFIPFGRLVRFDRIAVEKWAEKKMVKALRGGLIDGKQAN